MFIIKVYGGLGNQMFQYAFGRSISLKHNAELFFDFSPLKDASVSHGSRPLLSLFQVDAKQAPQAMIDKLEKDATPRLVKFMRKVFGRRRTIKTSCFHEPHFHFCEEALKVQRPTIFSGYWQSSKYFSEYQEAIRKDFTFPDFTENHNKDYANAIAQAENAVSLHIRRGDYIANPATNKVHGVPLEIYYQDAVKHFEENTKNPHFFIFSDDIDWVKENLTISNMTLVAGNSGDKAFRDMQLMSLCKHHILANSSFSWWGAWLSNMPGTVIAPKMWFLDTSLNTKDLYEESWLKF